MLCLLLPQVHVKEDEDGTSFRNLSSHLANTEEDALNLVRGCGSGAKRERSWAGSGSKAEHCNPQSDEEEPC